MAKITVELNDDLEDWVEMAIDDVKTELTNYLEENEPRRCPDIGDLNDSGTIDKIIDGACPVYTRDIKTAWFLHGSDLKEAYDDSGIGDDSTENDGATAIYCYIRMAVNEWFNANASDIFDEWEEAHDAAEKKKELLEKVEELAEEHCDMCEAAGIAPDEVPELLMDALVSAGAIESDEEVDMEIKDELEDKWTETVRRIMGVTTAQEG